MKKKKVAAFVLAATTTGGVLLASNATIANADEVNNNDENNQVIENQKAGKTGTVVNVTSSLRVREGKGTSTKVLGYLKPGQTVQIKEKSGDWYKIAFGNGTGYVSTDYIKVSGSSSGGNEGGTTLSEKGKVVNVTSSLRVRSSASASGSVVGYLSPNQTFDIKGKSGDWFKIKYDGRDGYVHKDYVQIIKENSGGGEVKPDTGSGDSQTSAKKGKVINITSNLRVRSSASTSGSVVGYLLNGESFDILGKSGVWYKIKKDGTTGYIHGDYVKVTDGESSGGSDNGSGGEDKPVEGNKTGQVVNITSNLRMRNGPSTSSSVVGYLLNGDKFDILGKSGVWYKIKKDGTTGYIHGDYVKIINGSNIPDEKPDEKPDTGGGSGEQDFTNQYGRVVNVSSSLRFRSEPSTNAQVIGYLSPNESVKVLKKDGAWYKITAKGKTGYAHSDYIKLVEDGGEVSSPTYDNVYSILKAQIGSPYVWGGKGELLTTSSLNRLKRIYPDVAAEGRYNIPSKYINSGYRAFDCSGLLYWGFSQVGINVGASTYDQINAGREVSMNDIRPGDLLFYGNLQHVGMYVGNGQWLEAPYSGAYVRITNVPYNKVTRARRVIN